MTRPVTFIYDSRGVEQDIDGYLTAVVFLAITGHDLTEFDVDTFDDMACIAEQLDCERIEREW